MNSKIISISMAKGGVGKSVTAINLSSALSINGRKVLLIDSDPQRGNATLALGQNPNELKITISHVLSSILDLGQMSYFNEALINISDNLDLLPANPKLITIEDRLVIERTKSVLDDANEDTIPSHCILKHITDSIRSQYDYIIIDCPPSSSMLTINALVASDSVILPMEAHYESYESLQHILDVIARIKKVFNPGLQVEGILFTKYQSRTNLCRQVNEHTEKQYGNDFRIFSDAIPMAIKAAELSTVGTSIFEYDPKCDVASAYRNLANEVMANEQ